MTITPTASSSRTLAILAASQIISWGSVYYAFAILAPAIVRDLGLRAELVFGAFSWSLLVAGLASAPTGILIDRYGGRLVMAAGSLLGGLGFLILSRSSGPASFVLAWTVLGVAMSGLLYEAAFATITHLFGAGSRRLITILTLFGGFASTVFWPLTLKISTLVGWRDTYWCYALLQLLVCLPLHLLLERAVPSAPSSTAVSGPDMNLQQALRHPAFWHLALAFAANGFIFSALSVHLIPILTGLGHTTASVVFMAALIGPIQVAGRICEMTFGRRLATQTVGQISFALLPSALAALLFFGASQVGIGLFCLMYGLSNGIITIVRGTIPQALFGARHYGAISGAMAGPSLLAKAAGPLALAAVMALTPSTTALFAMLFACSLASLIFYQLALRAPVHSTLTTIAETP